MELEPTVVEASSGSSACGCGTLFCFQISDPSIPDHGVTLIAFTGQLYVIAQDVNLGIQLNSGSSGPSNIFVCNCVKSLSA